MVLVQAGGEGAAGPTAGEPEAAERWELRQEEPGTREEEEDGGAPEQPCPFQVHDMEAAGAAKPGGESSCPSWTCYRIPGG